mmetsp:Transcript_2055/g.6121  ORF Transcript_2055/g.6121 Transcript_2055/m.6121 type:complete len:80 (-) Transcript_2055:852-1091(-)
MPKIAAAKGAEWSQNGKDNGTSRMSSANAISILGEQTHANIVQAIRATDCITGRSTENAWPSEEFTWASVSAGIKGPVM